MPGASRAKTAGALSRLQPLGTGTLDRSSSSKRKCRSVTGLFHIRVFMAGARMTGLEKSHAQKDTSASYRRCPAQTSRAYWRPRERR